MADRNDKYRQRYIADMSAHIGRPVETVGIFSRPGSDLAPTLRMFAA